MAMLGLANRSFMLVSPAVCAARQCPSRVQLEAKSLPSVRSAVLCKNTHFYGTAVRPDVRHAKCLRNRRQARVCASSLRGPGSLGAGVVSSELVGPANAIRRLGWISFWLQLSLSIVSAVILVFSVLVANQGRTPDASVFFTLIGLLTSLISSFVAWGYTRIARKILAGGEFKKDNLITTVLRNSNLNLWGMGATIIGLQASVGLLVGKTLVTSTSSPYTAAGAARNAGSAAALDIFSVQASTNTLLAHFASIVFANWLLRTLERISTPASPGFKV